MLNLRSSEDVISVIKLNPPYNLMVELSKIVSGRAVAANLELLSDLVQSIYTEWKPDIIKDLDKPSINTYNLIYEF